MCEICHSIPCHSACPNAQAQVPVMRCRKCREPLYEGDKHYEGICKECLDDMDTYEWLELFGENLREVKGDELG